jgi:hypothetical protein
LSGIFTNKLLGETAITSIGARGNEKVALNNIFDNSDCIWILGGFSTLVYNNIYGNIMNVNFFFHRWGCHI